eukprot:GHVN01083863.1.p1 GENE.GHVN01083863.1~~GHVN01083863.1.p1  ORF type:complete len:409 (+),score=42.09 GHVN01083863.1:513-1739(+)
MRWLKHFGGNPPSLMITFCQRLANLKEKIVREINIEILDKMEELLRIKEELRKAEVVKKVAEENGPNAVILFSAEEKRTEEHSTHRSASKPVATAKRIRGPSVRTKKNVCHGKKNNSPTKKYICVGNTFVQRRQQQGTHTFKWWLYIKADAIREYLQRVVVYIYEENIEPIRVPLRKACLEMEHESTEKTTVKIELYLKEQTYPIHFVYNVVFFDTGSSALIEGDERTFSFTIPPIEAPGMLPSLKHCRHCGEAHSPQHEFSILEDTCLYKAVSLSTKSKSLALVKSTRLKRRCLPCLGYIDEDNKAINGEEARAIHTLLQPLQLEHFARTPTTATTCLTVALRLFVKDIIEASLRLVYYPEKKKEETPKLLMPNHIFKMLQTTTANADGRKTFLGHRFDFLTNSFLE